jgi:hypothetical protein
MVFRDSPVLLDISRMARPSRHHHRLFTCSLTAAGLGDRFRQNRPRLVVEEKQKARFGSLARFS